MAHQSLHSDTQMGAVALNVSDLERSVRFYTDILGFAVQRQERGTATLGVNGTPLLSLAEQKGARPNPPRATGLYHFAVLMPSRAALGRSIRQLAESRYPLGGASDHLVSEAFYLSDPDGIGIELYRDRPRAEWPRQDGTIRMASDPIDLEGILGEASAEPRAWTGLEPGTRVGHVHLQVADIPEAERFYVDVLGFDIMVRWHGALFVSAGGYHHHLGMNTWNSLRGPRQAEDAAGLRYFTVALPNSEERARLADRLASANAIVTQTADGPVAEDPFGNRILLAVAESPVAVSAQA